jgi:cystathionine beta-lyase/cystathionine gamma-synthase
MKKQAENALQLAEFLKSHPSVEKVNYPGLPSHQQHALVARQMSGWVGMFSFEVRCGVEAGRSLLNRL